jgi:hypothetical protein
LDRYLARLGIAKKCSSLILNVVGRSVVADGTLEASILRGGLLILISQSAFLLPESPDLLGLLDELESEERHEDGQDDVGRSNPEALESLGLLVLLGR